jgi:hypothetical protein
MACAVVVSLAGVAMATSPVAAAAGNPRFRPAVGEVGPEPDGDLHLPLLTAPQAIALLNQQRAANGIPGDLVEEPILSAGCLSWATVYREAKGQYPHEEVAGQPGYTSEGNEAASRSDLDGEPGSQFSVGTQWGTQFNPWSGAPLHQSALMNPAATSVWYGASQSAACLGTTGGQTFASPTFFSVPGPGASNVPIAESSGELPFSPEQAVGLEGREVAPAILVWDEGSNAKLTAATVTTAAGAPIPTSLVTPGTPTPPAPSNFPSVPTFGGYTTASFVMPRAKFKPNTAYTLTATWQNSQGATSTQTVTFTTAATDLSRQIEAVERAFQDAGIESGTFTPVLNGRTLTITATGLAIGRNLTVQMLRCTYSECGNHVEQVTFERTVRLAATALRVKMPLAPRGKRSTLELVMRPFHVKGRMVYPGQPALLLPRR